VALAPGSVYAVPPEAAQGKVTAVRFWSLGDVTRVAVEVDSDFKYRSDRLRDPDRLFFDIQGARPQMVDKGTHTIPVSDAVLKQIRVAETQKGVTRVVLDLEQPAAFTAAQLSNPARLMIELRLKDKAAPPAKSVSGVKTIVPESDPVVPPPAPVRVKPEPRKFEPPPPAPKLEVKPEPRPQINAPPPTLAVFAKPARLPGALPRNLPPPAELKAAAPGKLTDTKSPEPKITASVPQPAKRNSNGDRSLTRVLGLKLGRVVLDPGHGGHDAGTQGPSGLAEKDLVLDVAQRLGKLLEDRLESEVVYTRSDDTFIPLEERTQIANEHKADLFLSIHANSSPFRSAAGVETYYLNFTTVKAALDLAARENASSERSIFDLKDLLAKIALKDKIDESREFASRVQTSLFSISAKGNAAAKNRGVKKAPFVVLIGADMPSVLAEIGFLTNATDETLLRRSEHRDKIAEALYKGIASYAETLSHFQVAKRQ
jgi:N-acetylmuramoyl-L-alanine amidase